MALRAPRWAPASNDEEKVDNQAEEHEALVGKWCDRIA